MWSLADSHFLVMTVLLVGEAPTCSGLVQLDHKWACTFQLTSLTTIFLSLSGPESFGVCGPGLRTECERAT